ncbi:SxtJ family membrane protein [Beijerinckia indica]|uniref:SxtJ n=1 Tax=Beijerinckia indica subsp. indica (strain ATCC 9039 / DSM 1715 / NCIMB 8712) TaxID=395963 RepID=B2IBA7_BEII9|nr:SxtJ family membrane protein [Beijerinckia indica]ACB95191.1 conserved hypothetical protein [Beijerinckia indica subsp. indica ATCC 9039]
MQHEPGASFRKVALGSDRKFGLVFGLVFAVLGLWPLARHGESVHLWALILAAIFVSLALVAPQILAPLNRAWFKLGLLLNIIVSPLLMGLMFFGAVFPFALFLRHKDLLNRRLQPQAETYWIPRSPPGPAPDSLTKQF